MIWFSENYSFEPESGNYWKYENTNSNHKIEILYDWNTSKRCIPAGWKLPSKADFRMLIDTLGIVEFENHKNYIEKINEMGIFLSGWHNGKDKFIGKEYEALFWSSSEYTEFHAYACFVSSHLRKIKITGSFKKRFGANLRLVKEL